MQKGTDPSGLLPGPSLGSPTHVASHHPQACLPACLPPASSSNWQSLTLMGEHGWAASLAGAASRAPAWETREGWCRASRASVPVSGSPFCVQRSSCRASGGEASFLAPTLLPASKGAAWEMQQGCPACLPACTLPLSSFPPAMESTSRLLSCASCCTYQEAFACSWLLHAISTSAGERPSASSAHWVLFPYLPPRTSSCDLQFVSGALR